MKKSLHILFRKAHQQSYTILIRTLVDPEDPYENFATLDGLDF